MPTMRTATTLLPGLVDMAAAVQRVTTGRLMRPVMARARRLALLLPLGLGLAWPGAGQTQPLPAQATPNRPWHLLMPGEYHAGEAPTEPGSGWLALTVVAGRWHLVPTQVRAEPMHDSVLDAEGQQTGIRISASHADALALLRGPRLQPGHVPTPALRFRAGAIALQPEQPIALPLGTARYQLLLQGAHIVLRQGAQRSRLPDLSYSATQEDAGHIQSASLRWAGDLDGDGRLDLILDHSGYNHGGSCVYLSTLARPGELLGRLACHTGVGC